MKINIFYKKKKTTQNATQKFAENTFKRTAKVQVILTRAREIPVLVKLVLCSRGLLIFLKAYALLVNQRSHLHINFSFFPLFFNASF